MYDAAKVGNVGEVKALLRYNPGLNVNWADENQLTALHCASKQGNVGVMKVLLAHPDINVNCKDDRGHTPISHGCREAHLSVVRELLMDPRVNVTLADSDGRTPLWWESYLGHCKAVELFVASGRDLHVDRKGKWDANSYTALEIARKRKMTKVVWLLERFTANPAHTRQQIRVTLGMLYPLDALAAEVFALTVFLCEDLLQVKPATTTTARFFAIVSKLPMELQMIMCHRAVGSMKQNVLHKYSEAAFKSLARILVLSQSNDSGVAFPRSSSFSNLSHQVYRLAASTAVLFRVVALVFAFTTKIKGENSTFFS